MSPRTLAAFRRRRVGALATASYDGALRITGHRGVRGEGSPPENTLAAFEEAASQGADAIELDVRVAADGGVVVLHDATLERVTQGRDLRAAASLPSHAITSVDLGAGASPPTLAAALAFARARRLAVNVEMKRDVPDRPAVVRGVARLLASWDPRHAVIVSSFDPAMLTALSVLAPRVPRALLVHRTWWYAFAALAVAPTCAHAVHIERTIASPALIRSLRRAGLVIQAWTVNHPGEARDLAALGVDGLITDVPGELRAALAS